MNTGAQARTDAVYVPVDWLALEVQEGISDDVERDRLENMHGTAGHSIGDGEESRMARKTKRIVPVPRNFRIVLIAYMTLRG